MSVDDRSAEPPDAIGETVRLCRIIELALVAGVAVFLAIVALWARAERPFDAQPWTVTGPLSLLAIGYAAVVVALHLVIPGQIVAGGRRALARGDRLAGAGPAPQADQVGLLGLYRTSFIVGSALVEGGALLATIAYLLEGKAPTLLVALALGALLLVRVPSRGGLEAWLERQGERLEQERADGA